MEGVGDTPGGYLATIIIFRPGTEERHFDEVLLVRKETFDMLQKAQASSTEKRKVSFCAIVGEQEGRKRIEIDELTIEVERV